MGLRDFTLHDMIERDASLYGERTAFVLDGNTVSHADYAVRAARLAGGLARSGLTAGDRIAVLLRNGQAIVDIFAAASRLGAIVVPVNWRLSSHEIAYVINDVRPNVLVAAAEMIALIPDSLPGKPKCFMPGGAQGSWRPFEELYTKGVQPPVELNDDEGFLIVHTAGACQEFCVRCIVSTKRSIYAQYQIGGIAQDFVDQRLGEADGFLRAIGQALGHRGDLYC